MDKKSRNSIIAIIAIISIMFLGALASSYGIHLLIKTGDPYVVSVAITYLISNITAIMASKFLTKRAAEED